MRIIRTASYMKTAMDWNTEKLFRKIDDRYQELGAYGSSDPTFRRRGVIGQARNRFTVLAYLDKHFDMDWLSLMRADDKNFYQALTEIFTRVQSWKPDEGVRGFRIPYSKGKKRPEPEEPTEPGIEY